MKKWLVAVLVGLLALPVGFLVLVAAIAGGIQAQADDTSCGTGGDVEQVATDPSTAPSGAPSPEPSDLPAGTVTVAGVHLDSEQQQTAAAIIGVGQQMGVPTFGEIVAVATSYQESTLRNLDGGLGSSIGAFQIIAANGTVAQRHDVAWSATWFYSHLLKVPGWQQMPLTVAAQAVQRSGFPDAYAQWTDLATELVGSTTGDVTAGAQCGIPTDCPPTGSPAEVDGLQPDMVEDLRCTLQQFPQLAPTMTAGSCLAAGGHINDSDHYTGRACDYMVPASGKVATPAGVQEGEAIAAWEQSNAALFGITYIIWHAHIWDSSRAAEGWRPYLNPACSSAATCDPTLQHMDHVHVSVSGNAGTWQQSTVQADGPVVTPVAHYVLTARFDQAGGRWSSGRHTGLDFAAPTGTPIRAVMAGTVTFVDWGGPYGWLTKIDHGGGLATWYAHQSAQLVTVGQHVEAGQTIGRVGATGNVTGSHCHLEVRTGAVNGGGGTPIDPETWYAQQGIHL